MFTAQYIAFSTALLICFIFLFYYILVDYRLRVNDPEEGININYRMEEVITETNPVNTRDCSGPNLDTTTTPSPPPTPTLPPPPPLPQPPMHLPLPHEPCSCKGGQHYC